MGVARRIPITAPDLFTSTSAREPPRLSRNSTVAPPPITSSEPRHILPSDLPNAIRQLGDEELDRLASAVIAEQKRRRSSVKKEAASERSDEPPSSTLTQGKLNAVRAAFKAGVKPSQIARHFGISQSDVRKALAAFESKR